MKTVSDKILFGLSESHVRKVQGEIKIHADVIPVWKSLCTKANQDGIRIQIASGFRSFDRQLAIWNEKCTGKRAVLDNSGKPIDTTKLKPEELIHAILRWSALPGMSRHHWGSDFDVFDEAVTEKGVKFEMLPSEAEDGGPFQALDQWLQENLNWFEFYRPYEKDLGGVSPEWWHISFGPVATVFYESFTVEKLRALLNKSKIQLKASLMPMLDEIHERYFCKVSQF